MSFSIIANFPAGFMFKRKSSSLARRV